MTIRTTPLALEDLHRLDRHWRECLYWEFDPSRGDTVDDPAMAKEAWITGLLIEWGSCGRMVWQGDGLQGVALYAPPAEVPRARLLPTGPVSVDAIVLTSIGLSEAQAPFSFITPLVDAVVGDLMGRGVRAIEAFGYRDAGDDRIDPADLRRDTAAAAVGDCTPARCMIPAAWLEELGFSVIAPHHRFPRLRLELGRDLAWKNEVEAALDRLFDEAAAEGGISPDLSWRTARSGAYAGTGSRPRAERRSARD